MGFFTKWFWLLAGAFFGLPLAILGWYWIVERVEVPSGKFVVLVHRWGNDLPENVMLAPDESYKGVMLKVLPEGRWFVNPLFWGYELRDLVTVPPGTCLVLCRKYGKDLPKERLAEGLFLVGSQEDGQEEKGILREVLR